MIRPIDKIDCSIFRSLLLRAVGWAEKQKFWNFICEHADSVDIHKTEGSYLSTFHFNSIGE